MWRTASPALGIPSPHPLSSVEPAPGDAVPPHLLGARQTGGLGGDETQREAGRESQEEGKEASREGGVEKKVKKDRNIVGGREMGRGVCKIKRNEQ